MSTGNPGGNILHNAPVAKEKSEAKGALKTYAAANGSLYDYRNRCTGIQKTAETTTGRGSFFSRFTSKVELQRGGPDDYEYSTPKN
jgi:hypothetical protein